VHKPKIGIIGFSDGDAVVHDKLKNIVEKQVSMVADVLEQTGVLEVVKSNCLVNSVKTAQEEARNLLTQRVDGTIFVYAVFSYPNFSAIAAKNGQKPFLLFANLNPDWPGMVAMLAAGGALHHLGINHFRAFGDIHDAKVQDKIIRFARCASVVNRLNGQKYGQIGGRSLGMYSTVVSMQDWQEIFGVDIEHIDQSEIVRIGSLIPEKEVNGAYQWLQENVGNIVFDGKRLTPEKLRTQIRHYEAIKRIISEYQLDFVGVKCHYEMSGHYCTECLGAAFINDPYDWYGPKEPIVFSCEADADGALTMQILKLLTGEPVAFMDVRHYDKEAEVMVFCNCGSQSTYYAGRSLEPKENLSKVTFYPCLDIYAGGGAHVNFMTGAGKATIARLQRSHGGKYRLTIIPAEFVELPRSKMDETTPEWPHVFAKIPFDHEILLEKLDANHCHAVYGDYREELIMICQMLGIEAEVLGDS